MSIDKINLNNNNGRSTGSESRKDNSSDRNVSLFLKLDKNKDLHISKEELEAAGYTGKDLIAVKEALFFAERDVNKWFIQDKNFDGKINNVEAELWDQHNKNDFNKYGDMTLEEFAKKRNILHNDDIKLTFENWYKSSIEDDDDCDIKKFIKERYGKDLTDEETELLYDAAKVQANRWLFKQPSLYERLNNASYTRLITDDMLVSCCGGDISLPPICDSNSCTLFCNSMKSEDAENSADEVKNRLAWAAFKTVSKEEEEAMTPEQYRNYKNEWEAVRNMKASDYRALLKPENQAALEKFEANSIMTVKQIVDYIDIIESVTGKDFDSDDWVVDANMFYNQINKKVNGTYDDDKILKGKTRADIAPERQEWLKYLESHDLLLDQFKE